MTCSVSFSFCLSILSAVHWSTDFSKLLSTLTQPCRSWWSFHSRSLHRPLWWVLKHAWLVCHCVSPIFMTLLVAESEFFQTTPFPPKCCAPQKGWTLRSALKQNLFVLKPPGNWSHLNIFERALQRLRGESNTPIDVGTDFFLVLQLGKNEWTMHRALISAYIVAYRTAYLECKTQTNSSTFENYLYMFSKWYQKCTKFVSMDGPGLAQDSGKILGIRCLPKKFDSRHWRISWLSRWQKSTHWKIDSEGVLSDWIRFGFVWMKMIMMMISWYDVL